jgi:hypothetical protein
MTWRRVRRPRIVVCILGEGNEESEYVFED